MERVHRDSMPKLVQPGRRRDKWQDEQRGTWVEGGPAKGNGFIANANRQHVRMRMSHGRKRGPGSDNNPEPQPKQPWKLKKKAADRGGISGPP